MSALSLLLPATERWRQVRGGRLSESHFERLPLRRPNCERQQCGRKKLPSFDIRFRFGGRKSDNDGAQLVIALAVLVVRGIDVELAGHVGEQGSVGLSERQRIRREGAA